MLCLTSFILFLNKKKKYSMTKLRQTSLNWMINKSRFPSLLKPTMHLISNQALFILSSTRRRNHSRMRRSLTLMSKLN